MRDCENVYKNDLITIGRAGKILASGSWGIGATRQPSADSQISPRTCNGESQSEAKRKVKTELYEIQTMHNPGCLLSKRYQSEAFEMFIKI